MPMYVTLEVPSKFPRWATGSGRTLEPGESSPSDPNKDDGWGLSDKPPARIMNWLQNLQYLWIKKIVSPIVSNFYPNADLGTAYDITRIIYHPLFKKWVIVAPAGIAVYYTHDGHSIDASTTIPGQTMESIGIDLSRVILGDNNGNLWYSSDIGLITWTQLTSAAIGGSGKINHIHTKYPDSDFTQVVKGTGIRLSATGIGGIWASPTTPPTIQTTPIHGLIYIGNSTWIVYSGSGQATTTPTMSMTTDDGDNWANVTTEPFGTLDKPNGFAYSRDSGRLIAVGRDSSNDQLIRYSDDLAATWNTAVINRGNLPEQTDIKTVYYCGGNAWVAVGEPVDLDPGITGVFVSIDNGETWHMPDINGFSNGGGPTVSLYTISCGERAIMLGGSDGKNMTSISMV